MSHHAEDSKKFMLLSQNKLVAYKKHSKCHGNGMEAAITMGTTPGTCSQDNANLAI